MLRPSSFMMARGRDRVRTTTPTIEANQYYKQQEEMEQNVWFCLLLACCVYTENACPILSSLPRGLNNVGCMTTKGQKKKIQSLFCCQHITSPPSPARPSLRDFFQVCIENSAPVLGRRFQERFLDICISIQIMLLGKARILLNTLLCIYLIVLHWCIFQHLPLRIVSLPCC